MAGTPLFLRNRGSTVQCHRLMTGSMDFLLKWTGIAIKLRLWTF